MVKTSRSEDEKSVPSHTWNVLADPFPAFRKPKRDNRLYKFIRTSELNTLFVTNAITPAFSSYNFQLTNVPGSSEFIGLFDQYRIDRVEVWIYPAASVANTINNLTSSRWASVIDYDDNTNLTAVSQATEYQTCIMTNLSNGHYRSFVPHAATALYSGVFTSFGNVASPWIDVASATVQHYGIKFAADASLTALDFVGQVRYHLTFRNVR